MSTKDNNSGLLSKVAKFVRNPNTNWTDLDKQEPEPEQETGYSKQALKEMIERKRQNDFVRKREFDQLRKLRRDPGAGNPDLARPSYFQNSLPANSNERAMTIKKIDEIEAQMSNQWWQGKQGSTPPAAAGAGGDSQQPPAAPPASAASRAGASAAAINPMVGPKGDEDPAYAATRLSPMRAETTPMEAMDFPPTRPNSTFDKSATGIPSTSNSTSLQSPSQLGPASFPLPAAQLPRQTTAGGFAHSRTFAVELADGISDPDLEEAAIRFANGDNAGAEGGLMAALRGTEVRRDLADSWTAALFDLYRATGQQARFDTVAIEYAERYGRSSPAWFSMPERQGGKADVAVERTQPSQLPDEAIWRSPALFDRNAKNGLRMAIAKEAPPWYLDWGSLNAVAPDVIEPLGDLFAEWCATSVQLRFSGAEALEQALRRCAPSGDKFIPLSHWRLRMNALRVMQLQDEFELVALDYCVTFEVSPPAWQDARCSFFNESPHGGAAGMGAGVVMGNMDSVQRSDSAGPSSSMGMESTPAAVLELSGEIIGEATDALAQLEVARQGAERMVISCANLIRVDFSAAGSILNWVATRQAEGCQLQFRDVHRLVAAFFNVIGINEHARVVVRAT